MTTTPSILLKGVVFFYSNDASPFLYFLQYVFLLSGSAGCETHRWVQEEKTDDEAQQTLQGHVEAVGLDPTRLLPAEQFTSSRLYRERGPRSTGSTSQLQEEQVLQCMEEQGSRLVSD